MSHSDDEPRESLCVDAPPRDRRDQLRFLLVLAGWATLFIAATYLIKHDLLPAGPLAWLAAALPSAAAVVALLAYGRYLRRADELQRLIHLQALALGFGAGWIAMTGYPLFERLGAPAAGPGDYLVVMVAAYVVTSLAAGRLYR